MVLQSEWQRQIMFVEGTVRVDGDAVCREYFGFDTNETFHEWIRYTGTPRCGGFTKSGRRCHSRQIHLRPGRVQPAASAGTALPAQKKGAAHRQVLAGGCVLLTPSWGHA